MLQSPPSTGNPWAKPRILWCFLVLKQSSFTFLGIIMATEQGTGFHPGHAQFFEGIVIPTAMFICGRWMINSSRL